MQRKLDRWAVGAPGRTTIYEILKTVYPEEDAALAASLPLRFASLEGLSRRLQTPPGPLRSRLEALADRGLVLDFFLGGKTRYMLTPTIVGFFEFSMMRARDDIDQRRLSELVHRYLLEERDFVDQFSAGLKTTPFRALVHEPTLSESYTEVLDWERASYLVREAEGWAVGDCHCRHVAHHLGRDCQRFRMRGSCLTLGRTADYLARHGLAREIAAGEARELLEESRAAGLVHLADNVQRRPTFICSCCGCCCDVLLCFKKFRMFGNTFSSNFEASVDERACNGCRKCEAACPVDAIGMEHRPRAVAGKRVKRLARVDPAVCLGCGVCAPSCEYGALQMRPRERRWITPETTYGRVLTMAIEQGKLQELLFDPDEGFTALAANALLGALLRLPPAKQALAQDALRSRFVDLMLARMRK